ncbi:hypothetical protein MASR1M59_24780 [Melaminivora sp.]
MKTTPNISMPSYNQQAMRRRSGGAVKGMGGVASADGGGSGGGQAGMERKTGNDPPDTWGVTGVVALMATDARVYCGR